MSTFFKNQILALSYDQALIVMIVSAIFFMITVFAIFSILPFLIKKKMNGLNFIVFLVLMLGWIFIFKISSEVKESRIYSHAFSEEKVFLYQNSNVIQELEYKYLYPRFYSHNSNSEQDAPSDTLSDLNPNSEKVCIRFVNIQNNETFSDLCALTPEKLAFEYFPLHQKNPNFVNFLNNSSYQNETGKLFTRFIDELNTLSLIK